METNRKWYVRDWEKQYQEAPEATELNMFDYGMQEMGRMAKILKRGLITKEEYNRNRNEIERVLLRIK